MKNSTNKRTLITGFSSCGKTFLMNNISSQKQSEFHIITKSKNQNPLLYKNISDEIQPLNEIENTSVVFDDMLLTKQESNIDMFLTRGRRNNSDKCYISQSFFHMPKKTFHKNSIRKLFS